MTKRKNVTLIKALILAPYILLLYILQSTVFTHITLFGVKPLLLPLAAAGMALFLGSFGGGLFGLFAGILMDLACNQLTVEFTLLLTLTGLIIGLLSDTVLVQGFPSFLVCAALQLLICSAFQVLAPVILRGAPVALTAGIAADQCVYTLVFALPIYYISRFLSRVI